MSGLCPNPEKACCARVHVFAALEDQSSVSSLLTQLALHGLCAGTMPSPPLPTHSLVIGALTHTHSSPHLPQTLLDSAQMSTPLGRPSIPLCLLFLAAPSPPDIRCHDLLFVFPLLGEETLGFVYLLGSSCWRTTALGDNRSYWGSCLPSQKV